MPILSRILDLCWVALGCMIVWVMDGPDMVTVARRNGRGSSPLALAAQSSSSPGPRAAETTARISPSRRMPRRQSTKPQVQIVVQTRPGGSPRRRYRSSSVPSEPTRPRQRPLSRASQIQQRVHAMDSHFMALVQNLMDEVADCVDCAQHKQQQQAAACHLRIDTSVVALHGLSFNPAKHVQEYAPGVAHSTTDRTSEVNPASVVC